MTTEHLTDDAVHDLADGALPASEHAAAEAHLARCGDCRARLERVRSLLRGAGELPRAVAPAEELWPGIRAEIERRQVVPLSGAAAAAGVTPAPGVVTAPRRPAWWRSPTVRLAAAGLLLVALSSGTTALFMGWRAGGRAQEVTSTDTTPAAGHGAAAASFLIGQEAEYLRLARDFEAAVAAQRDSLSPETIATVERSVRVIDAAIEEARSALERDPGNRALVELLRASYRQKLDLLRRTSQLAAGA